MGELETNPGDRLVAARTLAGYPTREDVASASGLSRATCWRIETTSEAVRPTTLETYGAPLGLDARTVADLRPGGAGVARLVVLDPDQWADLERLTEGPGELAELVGSTLAFRTIRRRQEETT